MLPVGAGPAAAAGVSGAIYTTNAAGDTVNQNLYTAKTDVYINGGPNNGSANRLAEGDYFFAVLSPGGQRDPNDGSAKNLSDGANGAAATRAFHTDGNGTLSLLTSSTHTLTSPANTLQLAPFDDTSNPGGVYIVAVCAYTPTSGTDPTALPVAPRDCKYDAFKVRANDPPAQVNSVFSGTKWLDSDLDGAASPSDTELSGWDVTISVGASLLDTMTTDASGEWTFTSDPATEGASGTTTYRICETLKTGWRQTGPAGVGDVISTGGASPAVTGTIAAGTRCYDVTVPNGANATASGLDFFNVPQGGLSGSKYYDSNSNGVRDTGEPGIPGWKITVAASDAPTVVLQTLTTTSSGDWTVTLDPGSYLVTEVQPVASWTQTGNTAYQGTTPSVVTLNTGKTYTVVVGGSSPTTADGLLFGNVCSVSPGGRTLGFWSNKNGQALVDVDDIAALVALDLRNADGTDQDFTGSSLLLRRAALRTFLLSGNATNMANMLSVQLAATTLSVRNGFTSATTVVDGTLTVAQVMAYADSLLATSFASNSPYTGQDGSLTVGASTLRTEQARVKDVLDAVNNSGAFVQGSYSSCPTPVFPT